MLNKEQFLEAMTFFDKYESIRTNIEKSMDALFENQFINFTANDELLDIHLKLLADAMELPRFNKDLEENVYSNDIEYWLYEANENIYEFSEPDENGKSVGTFVGKEEYKFWDVDLPDKTRFRIKTNADLYDYLKAWYDDKNK